MGDDGDGTQTDRQTDRLHRKDMNVDDALRFPSCIYNLQFLSMYVSHHALEFRPPPSRERGSKMCA